jgi:Zn-dependent M28 family amino/carboxypeptidase
MLAGIDGHINNIRWALTGIRMCFFTGEEQGLLGSRALASLWSEQGHNIVAMVNADMLGYQATSEVSMR